MVLKQGKGTRTPADVPVDEDLQGRAESPTQAFCLPCLPHSTAACLNLEQSHNDTAKTPRKPRLAAPQTRALYEVTRLPPDSENNRDTNEKGNK